MKTILVPTDFSPAAANATRYAAEMARAIGARVHLLHVFGLPISYSEVPVLVDTGKLIEDAGFKLQSVIGQLQQNGFTSIEGEVVEGNFYAALKLACEKIHPFVVVMGSQGTTSAERLFFGGHTAYTLQHLLWPVMAVPKDVSWSSIKKIGLACDFDEVAETPVQEIRELVQAFHAALFVLNTGKKADFNPEIIFESGLLQNMLARLHPQYHVITGSNTDRSIMTFAVNNGLDLLIVLPKRHGLADLFHKSHTKQLVLHCHVPVMALHMATPA